ncbi:MAG TPA: ABC transporter permease [Candidatus Polarisedimenticolia bacterium]|nr:ABC transporter permease [Candidatus Polarisedimenticolia bacterium]
MRRLIRLILFLVLLVGAWQLICHFEVWPPYLLPKPSEVAGSLLDGMRDRSIPIAVRSSLVRLGIGFGLSILVGGPLGILLALSRLLRDTLGTLVLGFQSLPSICWFPLALLWFGLSEKSVVFVAFMGSVLSIAVTVEAGIRTIPPQYLRVARNLGAKGPRLLAGVILPAALPSFVAGTKLGWSFAWRSLLAGELLFAGPGLGFLLTMGRELNDMARVIGIMLVVMVIGVAVDRLVFAPLERKLMRAWGLGRA